MRHVSFSESIRFKELPYELTLGLLRRIARVLDVLHRVTCLLKCERLRVNLVHWPNNPDERQMFSLRLVSTGTGMHRSDGWYQRGPPYLAGQSGLCYTQDSLACTINFTNFSHDRRKLSLGPSSYSFTSVRLAINKKYHKG
jgi:hypothetical protein